MTKPTLSYSLEAPMGTALPAAVHTLHVEDADGVVRQYGFHFGSIRQTALKLGEERAEYILKNGAKSVALRQDRNLVKIWDFRDFS